MIIFIIPYHKIGGAEKVHLEIIKSVNKFTNVILLFTSTDDDHISKDFIENSRKAIILNSRIIRISIKALLVIISHLTPLTILGCNSDFFYTLLPRLSKKSNPIDLTHAFFFSNLREKELVINTVPYLKKRVIINKKIFEEYKNEYKNYGIDNEFLNRFQIIPNGVTIKEFSSDIIVSRFHDFRIGFVGRFSYEKRPELFLTLADSLFPINIKAKMITDSFKLSKTDYQRIEIVEGINDPELLRNEFTNISLLIVSSSREGFPLVIMEAMELGIPVISTAVGSIDEHLQNGINGYISDNIENDEFLNFCKNKIHLLANDNELYTNLSKSARQYAESHFDIDNFREAYRKILLH